MQVESYHWLLNAPFDRCQLEFLFTHRFSNTYYYSIARLEFLHYLNTSAYKVKVCMHGKMGKDSVSPKNIFFQTKISCIMVVRIS